MPDFDQTPQVEASVTLDRMYDEDLIDRISLDVSERFDGAVIRNETMQAVSSAVSAYVNTILGSHAIKVDVIGSTIKRKRPDMPDTLAFLLRDHQSQFDAYYEKFQGWGSLRQVMQYGYCEDADVRKCDYTAKCNKDKEGELLAQLLSYVPAEQRKLLAEWYRRVDFRVPMCHIDWI